MVLHKAVWWRVQSPTTGMNWSKAEKLKESGVFMNENVSIIKWRRKKAWSGEVLRRKEWRGFISDKNEVGGALRMKKNGEVLVAKWQEWMKLGSSWMKEREETGVLWIKWLIEASLRLVMKIFPLASQLDCIKMAATNSHGITPAGQTLAPAGRPLPAPGQPVPPPGWPLPPSVALLMAASSPTGRVGSVKDRWRIGSPLRSKHQKPSAVGLFWFL